jgi:hypothetical protein
MNRFISNVIQQGTAGPVKESQLALDALVHAPFLKNITGVFHQARTIL